MFRKLKIFGNHVVINHKLRDKNEYYILKYFLVFGLLVIASHLEILDFLYPVTIVGCLFEIVYKCMHVIIWYCNRKTPRRWKTSHHAHQFFRYEHRTHNTQCRRRGHNQYQLCQSSPMKRIVLSLGRAKFRDPKIESLYVCVYVTGNICNQEFYKIPKRQ